MFRLGALSIDYNGTRIGWNGGGIRHAFQNKFAHTSHWWSPFSKDQPYFKHLGGKGTYYGGRFTDNQFTLWSF
jgi:hypothetical protein